MNIDTTKTILTQHNTTRYSDKSWIQKVRLYRQVGLPSNFSVDSVNWFVFDALLFVHSWIHDPRENHRAATTVLLCFSALRVAANLIISGKTLRVRMCMTVRRPCARTNFVFCQIAVDIDTRSSRCPLPRDSATIHVTSMDASCSHASLSMIPKQKVGRRTEKSCTCTKKCVTRPFHSYFCDSLAHVETHAAKYT